MCRLRIGWIVLAALVALGAIAVGAGATDITSSVSWNTKTVSQPVNIKSGGVLTIGTGTVTVKDSVHIAVEEGGKLILKPGAKLRFEAGSGITVKNGGTLDCAGTSANRITFEGTQTGSAQLAKTWRGIALNDGATVAGSCIAYATISDAEVGLQVTTTDLLVIEHCAIRSCVGRRGDIPDNKIQKYDVRTGLLIDGGCVFVNHCTVENCTWGIHVVQGLDLQAGKPSSRGVGIAHCTIQNCNQAAPNLTRPGNAVVKMDPPRGIHIFEAKVVVTFCRILANTFGMEVGKSIVTIGWNVIRNSTEYGILFYQCAANKRNDSHVFLRYNTVVPIKPNPSYIPYAIVLLRNSQWTNVSLPIQSDENGKSGSETFWTDTTGNGWAEQPSWERTED